ncbi:MAG TPA: hypothetical protein VJB97_01290 [Candidatus Paceibacterota bacterium]
MTTAANELIGRIVDAIINPIILVVFAFGFFIFTWGMVQFLWNMRGGEVKEDGKQHMLWGIIGMLIMVSVYGIISLIDDTLDLDISNPNVNRINDVTFPSNFTN